MFKKKIKFAAIFIGALALVACHRKGGMAGFLEGPVLADDGPSNAESYGVKRGKGYREASGKWVNALRAPANQTYYFPFDSNHVTPEDREAIQIQAKYLETHRGAKVRLEGNTDNRGSREYNIALGWRRAQAIARFLESFGHQRISPKQIEMVSYGKERPAVSGDNEEAWSLNRRVNLVYKAY